MDLVDVTAQDSDSTESFVAADSRSEVLSDDQERDGASVFEGSDPVEVDVAEPALQIGVPNREALGLGLRRLDEIDLVEQFQRRPVIMRSAPVVMSGSFKAAMRLAIDEVADGVAVHDEAKQERGWKLFLLLPRMLLQRPSRGGLVPKSKLQERLRRFAIGDWIGLLQEASMIVKCRKRPSNDFKDEVVLRAARAEKLAQFGELSAARQALEGDAVAPGTLRTLASLTNPERRPPLPREPLPDELSTFELVAPFPLDAERFIKSIRSARRGAAGGPSGMTTEHLRPMMDNMNDMERLCLLGGIMARGEVPVRVEPAIRLGRMTDGGIRGIVVGDVFRRLIARTMAQQIADAVEAATAPFQYALKTKGGCECVAHILQAVTNMDERATTVSVDGLGAFDLVSRKAMLQGLMAVEGGPQLLPFVRTFYGQPSVFLWEDEVGKVHQIHQGEGGEQGDRLMPLLFSLAQHSALAAAHERLNEGEHLFASHDDLYTVCLPERVGELHRVLAHELAAQAHIALHHGKTKVWNRGGHEPPACIALQARARLSDEDAIVWRGNHTLPNEI